MKGKRLPGAQIDRWAEAIASLGLSSLALPLLDTLDAFGFLIDQAVVAAEPLLDARKNSVHGAPADQLLGPDLGTELRRRLRSGPCEHE